MGRLGGWKVFKPGRERRGGRISLSDFKEDLLGAVAFGCGIAIFLSRLIFPTVWDAGNTLFISKALLKSAAMVAKITR